MTRLTGERFVPTNKILGYLLNTSHVDGASKARFFLKFGFNVSDPDIFIKALSAHPANNELISSKVTVFGTTSVVQCRIETPDGRDPCVRTVWQQDAGATIHRLVTAYPAPV